MIRLNIHDIKIQFSKYVEMVEQGETIVVCKRNVPVAEIRPIDEVKIRKPVLGSAAGSFEIPSEFYEPLPEADLVLWEGGSGGHAPPANRKSKKNRK